MTDCSPYDLYVLIGNFFCSGMRKKGCFVGEDVKPPWDGLWVSGREPIDEVISGKMTDRSRIRMGDISNRESFKAVCFLF